MPDTSDVVLEQQQDYRFTIRFGPDLPVLLVDEPAPLGTGAGPSPVQLLCASVGNCLADSLLFAFRKFRQSPEPLRCEVSAEVGRHEENRLRVLSMTARLTLGVPGSSLAQVERVLGQFEAFCTVTQSVGQGIPIRTEVYDIDGVRLK